MNRSLDELNQIAMRAWDSAHYGAHVAMGAWRDFACRAFDIRCSCGELGRVFESISDDRPCAVAKEHRHMCTIRDAMAAMINVMVCVQRAFICKELILLWAKERSRSNDLNWPSRLPDAALEHGLSSAEIVNLASREWSAEVRRKVTALPKPGPVVRCQGEED